jgi:hypothetical protein
MLLAICKQFIRHYPAATSLLALDSPQEMV